jgi:hypothetical protein
VYNDWDGVGELVTLPDQAAHRVVDKIVLATSANNPHIKTAIVCPPTIYGPGRGPDNQRSNQAYKGANCILQRKKGFMPGKGKNIWHQVHVQDLSELYLLLGEAAVSGGGKATWNEQGYYLAENSNRLRRLPIRKASFRPMSVQAWKPASSIPLYHMAPLGGELIHEVSLKGGRFCWDGNLCSEG